MGLAIEREQFNQADYLGFQRRLEECLLALARLLRRPSFGTGPSTVGAELELFLVDDQVAPCRAIKRSGLTPPIPEWSWRSTASTSS